ncbi:MAG: tetratricopeptide repeat protein [Alphaproteobacteria bacterium]|nr:tetratricopeptide repeat protein [Alphaproteobacteria bacterium]
MTPETLRQKLGEALKLQRVGKLDESDALIRDVIQFQPDHAGAHHLMGVSHMIRGDYDAAEASMNKALDVNPRMADAVNNLGIVRQLQGRADKAIECFRRALELYPELSASHSNVIFSLDHEPGVSDASAFAERRLWNERFARKHHLAAPPCLNDRDPERVLRVGYVSGDYRNHSAAHTFMPVLFNHDPRAVELWCYSTVTRTDNVTDAFRKRAKVFRDVAAATPEQLAEQVRVDRIDVLVDLSGHSEANRLPTFARRPAPVTVSAWGFATATGVDGVDYFFADPHSLPYELHRFYAEKVVMLPVAIPYSLPSGMPAIEPLPSLAGAPFTFGCLNRLAKVTDPCLGLWARVLTAAPEARLLMKDRAFHSAQVRLRVLDSFAALGIDRERIELLGPTPRIDHVKTYHRVDLALDPIPAGGGMTMIEGLWMGVPSLSLIGQHITGRLPSSLLVTAELGEFVFKTADDYVAAAVRWTGERARLAEIRAGMRERLKRAPYLDHIVYTRRVERAYRAMWRRWCAGLSPAPFVVG